MTDDLSKVRGAIEVIVANNPKGVNPTHDGRCVYETLDGRDHCIAGQYAFEHGKWVPEFDETSYVSSFGEWVDELGNVTIAVYAHRYVHPWDITEEAALYLDTLQIAADGPHMVGMSQPIPWDEALIKANAVWDASAE